jgi:hypothetical protein
MKTQTGADQKIVYAIWWDVRGALWTSEVLSWVSKGKWRPDRSGQAHPATCRPVSSSLVPAQAASLFFTLASRKPDVTLSRYAAIGDSAAEGLRCRNNTDAC